MSGDHDEGLSNSWPITMSKYFRRQFEAEGPKSSPDPRISRYFKIFQDISTAP